MFVSIDVASSVTFDYVFASIVTPTLIEGGRDDAGVEGGGRRAGATHGGENPRNLLHSPMGIFFVE